MIAADGRVGHGIPGDLRDLRDESFCRRLVEAVQGLGGRLNSRHHHRGFRCEYLRALLDHQGGLTASPTRRGDHGTASEHAYDPSLDLYDYAQTKAATMNYVKSLAKQLGPREIRVNAVAPGPIWTTPLQVSGGAPMERLENFGGQTPIGRAGNGKTDFRATRGV